MSGSNIKIASWNVEGRLSNLAPSGRGNAVQIMSNIEALRADIMVLVEAHTEESLDSLTSRQGLTDLGYQIHNIAYNDDLKLRADTYADQLSMMLLSKYPIRNFETLKLGNLRNCMIATIEINNQLIRVIGLHLDDRLEETRLRQISDLIKEISKSKLPTIVMGDFNAMHGEDLWPAKMLRSKFSRFFSHIFFPSLSGRAIGMAEGKTLKQLEENTGLIDIDKSHRPTTTPKIRNFEYLPSIRLIQIDHIYASKNIKISDFSISADGGADHRAVSVKISI